MSTHHVACAIATGPNPGYWKALSTYEISGGAAPNSRTLNRWRREAPEAARFVVPVDAGLVAAGFEGDAAESAWAATLARAERTGATTALLRTPSQFRPTRAHRDAVKAFFTEREGLQVAWWAQGLWDVEDQAELCAAAGVLPVVDPLALEDEDEIPDGPFVYWRVLGGAGMSARFTDYELDRLCDLFNGRAGGTVVFGAPEMFGDARRFAQLLTATRQFMAS